MAEARLPKRVDAVKLVEVNQHFHAKIDTESLTRLREAVEDCEAIVECDIEFMRDQEGHRVIQGSFSTRVSMVCQRCLGLVEIPINSHFELGLVFDDEQAKQLPRRLEPVEIEFEGLLDLWGVIEDEILLSLPSFPTHAVNECHIKQPEPETNNTDIKRPNPFDVLAKLKQK